MLFAEKDGTRSSSQIMAFEDTWEWNVDAERAYEEIVEQGGRVSDAMRAFRTFLGHSDMLAYLAMMAPRLIELKRVLKVHCDPTASHYLKMLMDAVFGPQYFRGDITWKRTSSHSNASRRFGSLNDNLLFYVKSDAYNFNVQYVPYSGEYIRDFYRYTDKDGRKFYLDNMRNPGVRPHLMYEYKGYKPHPNGWTVSKEKMAQLDAEGPFIYPKTRTVESA